MKTLMYVTASFPYGPAESFLIAESQRLAMLVERLYVVPVNPKGPRRQGIFASKNTEFIESPLISQAIMFAFLGELIRSPFRLANLFSFLIGESRADRRFLKNIATFPKAVWLAREMRRLNVDHVHVHWGSSSSSLVMLAARLASREWSFTCHRWDIYENNLLRIKSTESKFVRFISRKGMVDALGLGVIAEKASVIPMGVNIDVDPEVRRLTRSVPVLFCAANLIEVKGHQYLIRAVKDLKDQGVGVRLLIAGEGALRAELEELVTDLELCDEITFLGHLSHDAVIERYSKGAVDLFILPSVDLGGGNHEGVPVSLMEAMSFGIPVIATKTGSIEELLPAELGLTVRDKDPVQLAECIRRLVQDPDSYSRASSLVGEVIKTGWRIDDSVSRLYNLMKCRT